MATFHCDIKSLSYLSDLKMFEKISLFDKLMNYYSYTTSDNWIANDNIDRNKRWSCFVHCLGTIMHIAWCPFNNGHCHNIDTCTIQLRQCVVFSGMVVECDPC
jgi:hypothetical protein